MTHKTVPLRDVLRHRKGSITIDDTVDYKLCRVQVHRKGVLLRQIQKGVEIRTKKQQVCKTGDFIVAEMDAKVGGYGFIPSELEGAIVSSHYYLFEVNENKLVPAYLQVLTQTDYIQSQIKATGSTNYASIRPSEVLELTIPLPSLERQKIIVEQYQTARNNAAKITAELKDQQTILVQLRQAILQEAVQGILTEKWRAESEGLEPTETGSVLLSRIRTEKAELIRQGKLRKEKPLSPITDAEKPFDLPEGWVWCRLGEVGVMDRGKSKHRPRNDDRLFKDGSHPFIQTGDVAQSKKSNYQIKTYSALYNEQGLAQSKKWPVGTLCITIAANIAETGFLSFEACFPDSVVGFTSLVDDSISTYVRYFLEVSKVEIEKFAPATAQKNINLGILDELYFPLPPLAEQQAIVAQVEQLLNQVSALETENKQQQAEVGRLMQAVLWEAFAGKKEIETVS